jgi:phenol hydroxylase P1 protein
MTIDLKTINIKPQRLTYAHVAKYIGEGKAPSRYQEATLGAQQEVNFHYRPTWDPDHELFDTSRTALQMSDWYAFKDPRQFYYASWTMARARQQDAVEANFEFVESRGMLDMISEDLRKHVLNVLTPLRHVAWGANMNNSEISASGYGTALTAPAMFHAMDNLGVAQYLTRLALTLAGPEDLDAAKSAWLHDPTWQSLRCYVEDTFVVQDPIELFVAQNVALDGLLYPLIYEVFVDGHVALKGGSAIAMLTAFMPEWFSESSRWVDSVLKVMAAESDDNKALVTNWARRWEEQAATALLPVAELALPGTGHTALEDVRTQFRARLGKCGISV